MDYEKFKIREYKLWTIYLHQDQTCLGRTYLWCRRENALDFLEMTEEEKSEFFQVAKRLKLALTNLFQPDLFNYAALGNVTNHLHVHLIPRHRAIREFAGMTFKDQSWGHAYHGNPEVKVPEEILGKIRGEIQNAIQIQV